MSRSAPPTASVLHRLVRALGANNLSGKIPATWSALPLHSLSVAQNDGVCGGVPAGVSGAVVGNSTELNATCLWDADGKLTGVERLSAAGNTAGVC